MRRLHGHPTLDCLARVASARGFACFIFAVVCLFSPAATAHEVRPAYLSLQQVAPDEFDVLLKTPMQGEARLALSAQFSGEVAELRPPVGRSVGGAMVQTWRVRAVEPLAGQFVLIDGLQGTMTDALVRVAFADGSSWTARLTPSQPSALIPLSQSTWSVFATYLGHGVEHILFGFDHLLFVAALMLIVRDWLKLAKAITAFTLAHSITLTCATFGWIVLPPKPVELMVALSIVMVAAEIVRMERGEVSLAITRPWIVAFAFGLLHGFGFAGALVDLGLPQSDIPLALLAFNVGVEVGQIAFVAVLLTTVAAARRIFEIPRRTATATAYAIGIVATFWCLGRLEALIA